MDSSPAMQGPLLPPGPNQATHLRLSQQADMEKEIPLEYALGFPVPWPGAGCSYLKRLSALALSLVNTLCPGMSLEPHSPGSSLGFPLSHSTLPVPPWFLSVGLRSPPGQRLGLPEPVHDVSRGSCRADPAWAGTGMAGHWQRSQQGVEGGKEVPGQPEA